MKILTLLLVTVCALCARAEEIRLQIVGPDKKPVVGAAVRIVESSGGWEERKIEAPRELVSDEAGKIAFETKNPLATPKIEPLAAPVGDNTVLARILAPQMAAASQTLKVGDNEITLQAGQTWGGVALDEEQKPVAGVKIVVSGLVGAEGAAPTFYLPRELQLETTTGEDGKWSFSNLPRAGSVRISIEDPRFVRETLNLPLNAPTAPPLFVERGATIKGRLLAPDGTPVANVRLHPGGGGDFSPFDNNFRTAPDGTFQFLSLRAGDFYVQSLDFGGRDKPLPFIIEPKNVKALKSGEIRDIGDWTTQSGIIVKGKVVESDAKTAIGGANVSLWGRGNSQGRSDKNGEFSFRAPEDASMSSISAQGFTNYQKQLGQAVNGVLDLGTIELKRGIEAKGTLKDKNGRGVGYLQVYAERARGNRQYGRSDNQGNFSFGALEAGDYTLKIEGAKLVDEVKFSVVAGQKTAPIEAVVDRDAAPATPQTVAGRALDNAGHPVAGAKISLRFQSGYSAQGVTAISGVDGAFEAKFSMEGATPKISKATRPGLLLARGGDFKIVDGIWRGDLIFQPRGTLLRGRVVNSEGKPAARAFVSLAGRNDVPIVQSDENGAFAIPDVALEGVTLVASNGRELGQATIEKAGGKIEIALPAAADYDAIALADEILPDSRLGSLWGERWTYVWDVLGTARMEAAILRAKSGNRGWDWTWNEYLNQLARRDPASLLARGEELLALTPAEGKDAATARLMLLRARSTDETERAKAQNWLGEEKAVKHEMTAASVVPLLRVGAVAEALKSGEGAFWVEYAAQIADQSNEKARFSSADNWGRAVAEIGAPALENFTQEWSAATKMKFLSGALPVFAARQDLETSRKIFAQMEALETEATQIAAKNDVRAEESFPWKPKDTLAQARGEIVELLAKTDPKTALEMAKGAPEYRYTELLLEIGKSAAKLGQNELAARVLREVFEARYSNVEPGASAAQIALGFDLKLADELFALTWEKSKPRGDDTFGYRPSVAAYASARARNWAGESRILIERDWAERIKSYKPREDNDYDSAAESLKSLVGAMAKIDARRALEMAGQLPEKGDLKAQARGQIAIALLAKD